VRPTSVFPTPASPSTSSGRSSVRERYTAVARSRSATYRWAAKAAWTESIDASGCVPITCNLLEARPLADAGRKRVPEVLRELLGGALQEPVVDRLHRLDPGRHRRHELVIEQPLPDFGRRGGDFGRAGEVESHYPARESAWASARRAATIPRCVRYAAEAWMSSFASTPATDAAATSAISSAWPWVPTSFAAAGARNGVSASPVNARSARVIIPLAT